jgi:adenylate cyclase
VVGVSVLVLAVSIILSTFVSSTIAGSLNQIKKCFDKIREFDLKAPIILKNNKRKFLYYEPRELQKSFQAMLSTLNSFSKYVPQHVVQNIVSQGMEAKLGLETEEASVFFLDVKDFTKISERLSPVDLVTLMEEAFEGISECILSHGGVIDKYIGDCVMCFFRNDYHEVKSVDCALNCLQFINDKNYDWKERNLPHVEVRIGICSGSVLCGNFGSSARFSYTGK